MKFQPGARSIKRQHHGFVESLAGMKCRWAKAALFSVLSVAGHLHAQPWSGIVSPSRAIDWTSAGVPGGIPNRTASCATLNPGATAEQINSAIQSCLSDQVVFLNAGTYNLSSGITFGNKSNVTLRGAGADQTKLIFTGNTGCHSSENATVCLDSADTNWGGGPSNSANWTAGYAKGTTIVTLSDTTNVTAGKLIILDQHDDTSDTGEVFVCETAAPGCTYQGPSEGQRANRGQQEVHKIVSVNGNQVTIAPPLAMPNWRASQSPQAWWPTSPIANSGIEDLSIDHSGNGGGQTSGIRFFNTVNCWLRGVRSINAARNHVALVFAFGTVIRDNYFYGLQAPAGSTRYGIEWFPGGYSLVENNIFQHVIAPIAQNAGMVGDVVAYNYAIDSPYPCCWMIPMMVHHATGDGMVLWEGNDGSGAQADNVHGTHNFSTYFRNRFLGELGKDGNTDLIHLWAYARFFNIVGNVLGRTGYYTTYESNLSNNPRAIFSLGAPDTQPTSDPLVKTTLMRWGNYDTVNNATRFLASEVPSGLSLYANPIPASQTLPASFYLTTKPSWWGTMPWPAVGPDVNGYSYGNPAQLCYDNSAVDSSYGSSHLLLFNAGNCSLVAGRYAQAQPPRDVTAVAVSASQIDLSWTPAAGSLGVTNYLVQRCQGAACSNFVQIAAPSSAGFTDTGLSSGTNYSYRVLAVDTLGNLGLFSNLASATTEIPPTAPGNLISAAGGPSQINLSWTASTSAVGLANYVVQRCQGAGCISFAPIATLLGTTYSNTGLSADTSYSYRVQAVDIAGNLSPYSNVTTGVISDTQPPTVPANLTAAVSGDHIDLSWTASTDNVAVTYYLVERCQGVGCSTFVPIAAAIQTTYSDASLAGNASYSYRVRARDVPGNVGPYSNIASATAPPGYVQGNYATPQLPQTEVSVTFTAAQMAGDLNVVVVGWNNSTAHVSAVTDGSSNTYTLAVGPTVQPGLASQSIYYAKNIAAAAAVANTITVTFTSPAAFPDVRIAEYSGLDPNNPVDVTAANSGDSDTSSSGSVTTTHATDLLFGANLVQTNTTASGVDFSSRLLADPDGDIIEDRTVTTTGSYSATAPVSPSGPWIMQMVAFRIGPVGGTGPPTAPGNVTATAVSTSEINLGWMASSSSVGLANYVVQRCPGEGCSNFASIAAPAGTTYSDTGLASNTTYSYRIQAVDTASIPSPFSNVASATTLSPSAPTAPGNVTAAPVSVSQINLSWTASTSTVGLASYLVQRCQGAGCSNFAPIALPYSNGYTYRRTLTVDHSQVPNTDQSNFPVLVRLTNTSLKTLANGGKVQNANGYDIAFYSDQQGAVPLIWELDSYDGVNGILAAWVKLPVVSHSVDTIFYLFYGNSSISTFQSTASSVWSNSFSGVWHLPNGTVLTGNDSTTNSNHAAALNGSTATAGQIDGAAGFIHGQNQFIRLSEATNGAYSFGDVTLSGWFKDTANDTAVMWHQNGQPLMAVVIGDPAGQGAVGHRLNVYWRSPTTAVNIVNGMTTADDGAWHHFAFTRSTAAGAPMRLYVDGVLQATSIGTNETLVTGSGGVHYIGGTASSNNLTGAADELRMAAAIRTADWIGAEYSNQKANSTFLGLGAELSSGVPGTTFSDTGLSSGTSYSYRVQAVDTAVNLSPFSNTASATTLSPPTAPGNVTATAISVSQINLSWTASSSTVGLANYIVQRCQGAGCSNFAQIATPAGSAFSDTGLSSGASYSYRVQAVDMATNLSPFSNTASATTQTPPTAPGSVTAAAVSTSQINLSWAASTSGVGLANYIVQRCQGAGCSNFAQIAAPVGTTFNDTGLSAGTSYSYRIQAIDTASNLSPFSNTASATTQSVPTGPTAPGNLTATTTSTSQIDLSWTASTSSAGIATYVVQRCQGTGCSNFASIAAPYSNGYTYRRALTVDHSQVPNTNQSNFPVLIRLTNPSLKTVANGGKVQNSNGYDIAFYSDQQGATPLIWELDSYDGVNGILAAWVKLPVVSHSADTTFYLFYGNPSISTFQSVPSSVWSNSFSGVWHLPNGTVLTGNDSTTNNNASTLNGSTATAGQIDGAAGFIHGQNQFIRLSETNNGAYSFGDVTLSGWFKDTVNDTAVMWHQNGQPLMAVVIGDPAGQGAAGHRLNVYWRSPTTAVNIVNGTTTADDGAWHHFAFTRSTAAGAPMRLYVDGVLQATSIGTNETLVTGSGGVHYIGGTASSNNLTGAADELRMAAAIRTADWIGAEYSNQKANSTFLGLGSEVTSAPPLVATTYSDTGLSSGTGYSYRVQAVDMAANVSPFSNTASAITQTPPTAPGNVTAAAVSASQINLSWTASSSTVGLANYIVQRCQGAGCSNFAQIAAPAATAFSDTGLSSGTSYSYRVQAVDTATNPSPFSNIASAATQTAPTAPSNLTATATSTSQIDLSWTASTSSAGIATYVVQRCQGAGCSNFAPIAAAFVNGYNYRRALTVDHNQVPNTDQSNFPVLVRLTNPSLKTVANGGKVQNANGYDIAFYSDQQGAAPLVWELDSYDGVNGILAAWVKLPVVSHGADTTFYLFYGNPSVATFQSIPSSVWSNGFSGVWHLPNGTVLTGNDSTTNNNASTLNGSTATAGQIDGAAGFIHGQNQFIRLSEANNGAYSFGDVTLSGWFKDTVNDTAVLWHQNGQPLMAVVIGDPAGQGAAGHRLNVYWRSPTTAVNILNGTTTADDGAWHHFAVTRSTASGAPMRLYVDGVLQAASSGTNETLVTGSGGVHYIGGTASSNNLTGAADEMRMAAAIRTADWIAAEYSNQKANSTFLGLGSEVASGSLPLLATTFSDTGLSPSTTYSYRVQAIDTASNPSPFSNTASATTQTPGGQSVTSALTSSLSCNPASLGPNASSTCTIALSRAAPGGGATVTLTNTNAMLTVPASVTVAAATTSATFHVATAAIPGDQSATVTSTYNGSSSSATISLVAPVLVSALSCNPVTLGPGAASVCTVTLNKNALAGGASVAVSTVNSLLTAPSPLTIAAGSSSASFTLQAGAFTANQSGSVTATYNGSTQSAAIALTVSVRVSSLVCTPTGVMSGAATSCTVTLSQPAPTNTTVALSSSSTLIAVPVGIVVTAGSTTKTFSASIASIAADTKGEVTATLGTSSQTVSLILWSTPALSSLACTTTKLAIGASTACTVTLSKSAGDVVVSLASNNPAIVVPATVTVPQGSSTAVFSATAQAAASGVVVSATFNGVSKSQSLAVSTTTP